MPTKFSGFTIPASPFPGWVAGYFGPNNTQVPVGQNNGFPFIDNNGNLQPISLFDQTGLTFLTVPTLLGQLYCYVGDSTVDLAKADALSTSKAFAGVLGISLTALSTARGMKFSVRFKPGLTLAGGDLAYISSTNAGLATNVEPSSPSFIKVIGEVVDASSYNPLDVTGSTAVCILDPQQIIINP